MIDWLVLSSSGEPWLRQARAPAWLLSPQEQAALAGLKIEKRTREWLAGRWAAKTLLLRRLGTQAGCCPAFSDVSILAGEDGAPRVFTSAQDRLVPLPYEVSISHSGGWVMAALTSSAGPGCRLGCDIETPADRSPEFAAQFFTPAEIAWLEAAARTPTERLCCETALWSVKEAALKTLLTGLRLDTRQVICQPGSFTPPSAAWTRLRLTVMPDPSGTPADLSLDTRLDAWWRFDSASGCICALAAACTE
jgi:phosphopantetheinyl transferase